MCAHMSDSQTMHVQEAQSSSIKDKRSELRLESPLNKQARSNRKKHSLNSRIQIFYNLTRIMSRIESKINIQRAKKTEHSQETMTTLS
jgi:type VI protein secretion system component VasF